MLLFCYDLFCASVVFCVLDDVHFKRVVMSTSHFLTSTRFVRSVNDSLFSRTVANPTFTLPPCVHLRCRRLSLGFILLPTLFRKRRRRCLHLLGASLPDFYGCATSKTRRPGFPRRIYLRLCLPSFLFSPPDFLFSSSCLVP